jgi:hypothetical protein
MATAAAEMSPGDKINFPNMLGTKRRRMRSGGGVSTATNNFPKHKELTPTEEKTAQTSKCKGANTIPIFLKSKCEQKGRLQKEEWTNTRRI